ncbi:lipid-A-disaccharide synthetase-like protein, partial [Bordetella bronchiseptica E012]|uniref:3-hydroxyacyl-CoA dehydrogenase NAD-binding domain-containing protein n=1 Tax=Bordetella bronchiseptica TaxID=518 RepID=UPI0004617AA0
MSSPDSALGRPGASHAVVIGGGTMGADVAVVLARALCRTTVVEPDAARAAALPRRAADNLAQAGRAEGAAHIAVVPGLDAVEWDSVGLVIECVPERLDIKQALFAELARRAPAHAILASNSSSFPISAIGAGLPTRERMLGLHFFMPAHLVPLVEVVLCEASDPACADVLIAGEPSGDLLAGRIIAGLQARTPDVRCAGIGGPQMAARGFEAWHPMHALTVFGYIDAFKRIPSLLSTYGDVKRRLLADPPSVFVGIDAPDFNLRLEHQL